MELTRRERATHRLVLGLLLQLDLLTERILTHRSLARLGTTFICTRLPLLSLVRRSIGEELGVSGSGEVAGDTDQLLEARH
jgi:hypothetical protein